MFSSQPATSVVHTCTYAEKHVSPSEGPHAQASLIRFQSTETRYASSASLCLTNAQQSATTLGHCSGFIFVLLRFKFWAFRVIYLFICIYIAQNVICSQGDWKEIKIMEKRSKSNSFRSLRHELCICGSQVPVEHILWSFNCVITVFSWTELISACRRLVDVSPFWHTLHVLHAHVHAHDGCTKCRVGC